MTPEEQAAADKSWADALRRTIARRNINVADGGRGSDETY
jgi:hypothetical protein